MYKEISEYATMIKIAYWIVYIAIISRITYVYYSDSSNTRDWILAMFLVWSLILAFMAKPTCKQVTTKLLTK